MAGFPWICTTCGHHTTITSPNHAAEDMGLVCEATAKGAAVRVLAVLIECPNQACRAQDIKVQVNRAPWYSEGYRREVDKEKPGEPVGIGKFTFWPVAAQPLSAHAPAFISADYNEAYLIRDLSPKASATLARRALQGMVRDFFALPKLRSLHDELKAIEEKCDPALYEAMMAVKSVGNIGAHPERDVSLMVDVEEGEPQALLDLIHLLDLEWYVARADRAERVARMKTIGQRKDDARALPAAKNPTLLGGP